MAVVEKKNGAVRICIDPQPLNKALKREHYKMPILDDVLPELQSSRLFSKLDVREAFYHVKLDEKSADLTTMITPFGRYRWKRLPFGLSVSSEIFQRRLNEALEGLHGCINVADDMIIHGRSVEEHDRNMNELTARCNERKILLNEGKACLKRTEIDFLGHVIGANGVKPDPNKVKAILDMPAPEDVAGVRRFCGIIQYLARQRLEVGRRFEPCMQRRKQRSRRIFHKLHADTVIRDVTLERLKLATEEDPSFQEMRSYVRHGWPDKQTLRPELKPFFDMRDSIVLDEGLLLKGERVVVPSALRKEMKEILHSAHLGHDSMMRRARNTVFWPGINN
ncbi:polyprotein [Elysia marginata]|uniref:Polyprotein n=1 Tax=Elysia marginata TaxID=1093978 RepID=A0AAV4H2J6_9GAST|nr:polyprotein [Elysia marginata]